MIPGVSRSGASIVAAMLLGADKRAAARVFVLPGDSRPWSARLSYDLLQEPRRHDRRSRRHRRDRIRLGVLCHGAIIVVKTVPRLRHPPLASLLFALVARHCRHARLVMRLAMGK